MNIDLQDDRGKTPVEYTKSDAIREYLANMRAARAQGGAVGKNIFNNKLLNLIISTILLSMINFIIVKKVLQLLLEWYLS